MLSSQEEQREREATLRNDASVREQQKQQEQSQREQTGTFFSHTHADEITGGGRFASVSPVTVVGSTEATRYPAAAAHQADPCGPEPPLGYDVNEMAPLEPIEPSAASMPSAEQLGAPVLEAPSPAVQADSPPGADDVETGTGAPPFSEGTDNG
jgi:hypothetical protein